MAYSSSRLLIVAPSALALGLLAACGGDDSSTASESSATETATSTGSTSSTGTGTTEEGSTTSPLTTSTTATTAPETTSTTTASTSSTSDTDPGTSTGDTDTEGTSTGGGEPLIVGGFDHPESALWDNQGEYWYISNIGGDPSAKDGDGFISRLNADGSVDEMQWATGFDAPKGLALSGGRLYVADIDRLHAVNTADGTIANSLEIQGAAFLNDVARDAEGTIYVSDTGTNTIHMFKPGEMPAILLQADELNGPNGLTFSGDRLFVASYGTMNDPGAVFEIKDGAAVLFGTLTGSLDGIVALKERLLVTDFGGQLYQIPYADGVPELMLDVAADHGFSSSADLGVARNINRIAIPDLVGDQVGFFPL